MPSPNAGKEIPVVLVGGAVNAFSVARSLGRQGVPVYSINHPHEHLCYSRYCKWIPETETGTSNEEWLDYLIGPRSDWLSGSVLMACNDAGVQMLALHGKHLSQKYLVDVVNPAAQLCMLDKLCTYAAAVRAGVPTPKFWKLSSLAEFLAMESDISYPAILKPLLSHEYRDKLGKKLTIATNPDELGAAVVEADRAGVEVMIVEMIPGPDSRLCSYFTYVDENGRSLIDVTKRLVRRFPTTTGLGCFHVTDQIPELRELSLRLCREVGLRGLANIEFKFDERDGRYKLIECNARIAASNGLLADAGCDLARFVYDRVIGRPATPLAPFKAGKSLWYPIEDFQAYRELSRRGELSLAQWLRSIARPMTLPYFRWSDPLPTLVCEGRRMRRAITHRFKRWLTAAPEARNVVQSSYNRTTL